MLILHIRSIHNHFIQLILQITELTYYYQKTFNEAKDIYSYKILVLKFFYNLCLHRTVNYSRRLKIKNIESLVKTRNLLTEVTLHPPTRCSRRATSGNDSRIKKAYVSRGAAVIFACEIYERNNSVTIR